MEQYKAKCIVKTVNEYKKLSCRREAATARCIVSLNI